jgi:hypothetical protein
MDIETDIDEVDPRIPIACTLTTKAANTQAMEWSELRDHASTVIELDAGVRMTFPARMVDAVDDLARRERACCAFLTLTTTATDDVMTLEIISGDPEALPVIWELAGVSRS